MIKRLMGEPPDPTVTTTNPPEWARLLRGVLFEVAMHGTTRGPRSIFGESCRFDDIVRGIANAIPDESCRAHAKWHLMLRPPPCRTGPDAYMYATDLWNVLCGSLDIPTVSPPEVHSLHAKEHWNLAMSGALIDELRAAAFDPSVAATEAAARALGLRALIRTFDEHGLTIGSRRTYDAGGEAKTDASGGARTTASSS